MTSKLFGKIVAVVVAVAALSGCSRLDNHIYHEPENKLTQNDYKKKIEQIVKDRVAWNKNPKEEDTPVEKAMKMRSKKPYFDNKTLKSLLLEIEEDIKVKIICYDDLQLNTDVSLKGLTYRQIFDILAEKYPIRMDVGKRYYQNK